MIVDAPFLWRRDCGNPFFLMTALLPFHGTANSSFARDPPIPATVPHPAESRRRKAQLSLIATTPSPRCGLLVQVAFPRSARSRFSRAPRIRVIVPGSRTPSERDVDERLRKTSPGELWDRA
jgi:hypothetical protein